jgi:hypothetical protein
MMCMFDDISFMDDLPKHDQYDEEDIKMNFFREISNILLGGRRSFAIPAEQSICTWKL